MQFLLRVLSCASRTSLTKRLNKWKAASWFDAHAARARIPGSGNLVTLHLAPSCHLQGRSRTMPADTSGSGHELARVTLYRTRSTHKHIMTGSCRRNHLIETSPSPSDAKRRLNYQERRLQVISAQSYCPGKKGFNFQTNIAFVVRKIPDRSCHHRTMIQSWLFAP
jgi:hypothetical protein